MNICQKSCHVLLSLFVRTCSLRVCSLGSFWEIYSLALWLVGFAGFQLVLIGLFKENSARICAMRFCPCLCVLVWLGLAFRVCLGIIILSCTFCWLVFEGFLVLEFVFCYQGFAREKPAQLFAMFCLSMFVRNYLFV